MNNLYMGRHDVVKWMYRDLETLGSTQCSLGVKNVAERAVKWSRYTDLE